MRGDFGLRCFKALLLFSLTLCIAMPGLCDSSTQKGAEGLEGKVEKVKLLHAFSHNRRKYKLIVNADAETTLGMQRMPLQFSATIEIETAFKRTARSGEIVLDVNVVGGVMRLFGPGWRQVERVGRHTVTVTMTPLGQVLNVAGLVGGDIFEVAAGLDVISLAVGAICIGLPEKPVGVGDSWQVEHYIDGKRPILAQTRLVKLAMPHPGQNIAHLEVRYDLPLDWFMPHEFRVLYGVRAYHKGSTQVEFDCLNGRVNGASGGVEIEVHMSIPIEELPPELAAAAVRPSLSIKPKESQERRVEAGDGQEGDGADIEQQADEPNDAEGNEAQREAGERYEELQLPKEVPMGIAIRAQFQLIGLE